MKGSWLQSHLTNTQMRVLEDRRVLIAFGSVLMFGKVKENGCQGSEPSAQNPVSQGVSCSILLQFVF